MQVLLLSLTLQCWNAPVAERVCNQLDALAIEVSSLSSQAFAKTCRAAIFSATGEFDAALAQPDVQDRMKKLGVDPLHLSLEEFEAMINKELEDNARLIKAAGITPN